MNRRRFLTAAAGLGGLSAVAKIAAVDRSVLPATGRPAPAEWPDNGITAAWLGHSTVLINFYGVRILTDPVLFSRIGIGVWLGSIGPKRLTSCALSLSELPDIDLVIVSHAHFDHLDTRSLASIPGKPTVVSAHRTADLFPRRRYRFVHELLWKQSDRIRTVHGDVEVTALEVKHWGARIQTDIYRGYNGYVVRREGRALLFGGDTAHTPLFASHRRYGPFEAAIMPIGAYDPWIHAHCTPEQSVAMANAVGARLFLPIHHKTFQLSRESFNEPIERTEAALAREPERLAARHVGDTIRIA